MLWGNALLAAGISVTALVPAPPPPPPQVYRIDLAGNQTAWSQDKPKETGAALTFHRYPGGLLVSIRKSEVKRITVTALPPEAIRGLRPDKDIIVIGQTGGGPAASGTGAPGAPGTSPLLPGERKDGTALFNPDRKFRADWDTKQVPGSNIPYPNSPNDYREGKTLAFPPAGAVQETPGDVPKMPPGNGELPRGPG